MTIIYRSVKGSKLTSAEVDGNFQYLSDNKQDNLTIDSTPTNGSDNPVSSNGVFDALATKQDILTIDSTPTDGSSNPVSSNGVFDALAGKQNTLTFDSVPTNGSTNPVTSDGVFDALATKQNTLTFDSTPTNGSTNPVTSDGVYDSLALKKDIVTNNIFNANSLVSTDLLSDFWNQFSDSVCAAAEPSFTAGNTKNVVINPNGTASSAKTGKHASFSTRAGYTSVRFAIRAMRPSGVGASTISIRIYNFTQTTVIASQDITLTASMANYSMDVTGLSANTQYLASIIVHDGAISQAKVEVESVSLLPLDASNTILSSGNFSNILAEVDILHNNYGNALSNTSNILKSYIEANPFSSIVFYTDAPSVFIEFLSTTYATNTSWAKLGVKVNDKYYSEVQAVGQNDYNYSEVTLPSGYNKVEIINGLQAKPSTVILGTWISKIYFKNQYQFTIIPPSLKSHDISVYGDSISVGGNTSGNGLWGWTELMKKFKRWSFINYSAGSNALFDYSSVSNGTAQLAFRLTEGKPRIVMLLIGTNDYGLNKQSASNFGIAYGNLLDYIHYLSPNTRVMAITPIIRTVETANSFGDTLSAYRTQITNAVAVRNEYATLVVGSTILTTSDLDDGVHPSPTGYVKLMNSLITSFLSLFTTGKTPQVDKRTTVADANYTVLVTDKIVSYTSLTAGRTVTLPTTGHLKPNQSFIIKDESGSAGTFNIALGTVDGASKSITTNYGSFEVYWNGSAYYTK